jgi:two-component system response regulator TtrR
MLSGYKDVAWTSGHNVLATLNIGKAYGLLVLDMNMPGMSGLEVMHSLSKRQTAHRMPVIAISGDRRYETPAIEAGACAFLLKPFNNGEIEATVYHALSTTSGKHR